MKLEPGWLKRQFYRNQIDIATWPEYMRRNASFKWNDDDLTIEQRKEAAGRLRARADELDPEGTTK